MNPYIPKQTARKPGECWIDYNVRFIDALIDALPLDDTFKTECERHPSFLDIEQHLGYIEQAIHAARWAITESENEINSRLGITK